MNDMRTVIVPKSDQINADDLIAGPITITVREVKIRPGTEQPVSIHFENDNGKPYKPCKSMARVMVQCWGSDANAYVGRSMTLYRDPAVLWAGMAVGGIRISHMTDITGTQVMALTVTKGSKKPFTVKPLAVEKTPAEERPPAADTPKQRYPTLFGIKSGQEWLINLAAALDIAATEAEVAEIAGLSPVTDAFANWPAGPQATIKELLATARARIASETSAPSFEEPPADAIENDPTIADAAE